MCDLPIVRQPFKSPGPQRVTGFKHEIPVRRTLVTRWTIVIEQHKTRHAGYSNRSRHADAARRRPRDRGQNLKARLVNGVCPTGRRYGGPGTRMLTVSPASAPQANRAMLAGG